MFEVLKFRSERGADLRELSDLFLVSMILVHDVQPF